jgi:hypothetical protein
MKSDTKPRLSGIKIDSGGGISVRVSARRMAELDAASAKAAADRAASQTAFDLMDAVMKARTDLEGSLAVNAAILGTDLDEVAALTMERHLTTDWKKLCATLDAARDHFIRGAR